MKINKKIVLTLMLIFSLTSCQDNIPSNAIDQISSSQVDETSSFTNSSSSSLSISSKSSSLDSSSLISSSNTSSSSSSSVKSYEPISNTIDYYNDVDLNTKGATLKTALYKKINKHTSLGYSGVTSSIYAKTDLREDGTIWDIYSNTTKFELSDFNSGNYKQEGDLFNREHIVPQSLFSQQEPLRSDLHHLFPTDGYVNNRRSNYPHANVDKNNIKYASNNNFTLVGESATSGVSGNVCEPNDEYKGDIARTYFYFVTAYQNKVPSFKSFAAFSNNEFPSLAKWSIKLYLQWSKQDPVSQKEIDRNQAIYQIQGNRNPFIDYPQLAEQIWGEVI